jgi:hypothetical protein
MSEFEPIDEVKEWGSDVDGTVKELNMLKISSAWDLYRHKITGKRNNFLYLEPKAEYGHEYTLIFIHGML